MGDLIVINSIHVKTGPAELFPLQGLPSQRPLEFGDLRKDCMLEHVPDVGRFLRIGTISDYRKTENQFIRDEDEGKFNFALKFLDGPVLSSRWLERATFGLWRGGAASHHYSGIGNGHVQIVTSDLTTGVLTMTEDNARSFQSGENFTMTGSLELEYESADAFVFCVTESVNKSSVIESEDYNGRWYIPNRNIVEFGMSLAAEISKKVSNGEGISKDTLGPLNMPGFPFPPY